MNFERIENFDVLVKEGSSKTSIIVLHGYGASFQDLAPLHQFLDPTGHFNWYFVDGPIAVDIGMGMTGKAWFPIDMMQLQRLIQTGQFEKAFSDHVPEGLNEVRDRMISLIEVISKNYDDVYLGGFSQGSMLSAAVAMKRNDLAKKLFLLSSTLFDEANYAVDCKNLKSIPTFQSHGIMDPVLPYPMADKLQELLKGCIDKYEFHSFTGGHDIPMDIINNLKSFLEE